jgi:hypothetical protein
MLRATAVVVDNADVEIPCRAFLGAMFIGGGSGVEIYKGKSAVSANHLGSVASGLHLDGMSFPVEVDVKVSGRPTSSIFVAAGATGSTVVVYVSK